MSTATPSNLLKSIPCFASLSPEATEWLLGSVKEQSYAQAGK